MTDIFVSYASEDRDRIEPLVRLLEDEGWSVWWDRALPVGPSYAEKIQESLDTAKCVVVAWSHNSVNSNWCRDEAGEGLERQCLVPIRIDDVRPPLGFRSAQTASLLGWPRERGEVGEMMAGIRDCLQISSGGERKNVSVDALLLPELSIAVLPFDNLSPDPEQEYFCDGLVDDIIVELSRMPEVMVISRHSSFAFKKGSADIRAVGRDLNARFLLRGSVRRAKDRVRVSAELCEAASAKTVWSNRYDRDIADIFAVQDELTTAIVTALDVQLVSGEQGRHRRNAYRSAEAGEALYKGMFEHYKFERTTSLTARKYFEEFIRLEPDSVLGYVWMAMSWTFTLVVGWDSPQRAMQQVRHWVDKSLAIEPGDPLALVGNAYYQVVAGDLDGALVSATRAIDTFPNLDEAWFVHGWVLMLEGNSNGAIRSLESMKRLCPILSSIKLGVLGTAYRNAGRYESAIETFNECLERNPDFVYAHVSLALVHGMMDDNEAATSEVRKTLGIDPDYCIERFVSPNLYRDKTTMDGCAEVLRRAGMPEAP